MEQLLENKSDKIIAGLRTNKEKTFTKKESYEIFERISDALIIEKRKIEQNQKKSRIEASKTTLTS
ncbi:hypothetical protein SLH46_21345 [Draconibacterium sp. IB214405]|uniref:hypothetical protein n=1 Tax=Draconibacterium sp. IB214405 TaxID=3097352 RepID=UPI002A0DEE50|nr:hypothetical protein [Draconibacterium sp. IB214405]MDX8341759.1 hypothetical protein [Draconibacterium sp. IB214405]